MIGYFIGSDIGPITQELATGAGLAASVIRAQDAVLYQTRGVGPALDKLRSSTAVFYKTRTSAPTLGQ